MNGSIVFCHKGEGGFAGTFMMVALNSRSAWSISALSLTLIFKLSLHFGGKKSTRVNCVARIT